MQSLQERVAQLWQEQAQLSVPERERFIFRTLKSEGYAPGQTLNALRQLRQGRVLPVQGPKTVFAEEYYGCQRDDQGEVLDPFLLQPIPKEFLISYTNEQGQKFCFDKRSLYRQITLGSKLNPFTREAYPRPFLESVTSYGASLRTVVRFGSQQVVFEPFAPLGELIVQLLRTLPGSLLENLALINPFYNGKSLYTYDLQATDNTLFAQGSVGESLATVRRSALEPGLQESPVEVAKQFDSRSSRTLSTMEKTLPEPTIQVYPFLDLLEKSELLLPFFAFVKSNRPDPIYETLYSALGSMLNISPILRLEEGFDFTINPSLTVIEVVKEFYTALGGWSRIQDTDLVFAQGISLARLKLRESISAQIPSEEVYHVPYRSEEEKSAVLNRYRDYAFHANDRPLLNALFSSTGADFASPNYTFQEVVAHLADEFASAKKLDLRVRQLLVKNALSEDEWSQFFYEVLRTIFTLGKAERLARFLDIFPRSQVEETLLTTTLKKFDLSSLSEGIRALVSKQLIKNTEKVNLFFTGQQVHFTDLQIAQLDDVSIFLAALNKTPGQEKERLVSYCVRFASKYHGAKILNYCLTVLDPSLSFLALLKHAQTDLLSTFLARFSTSELNKLVSSLEIADLVNSNDEENYKQNVLLLLSDPRLTNATLLETHFWQSSVVLAQPQVWLQLRNFTAWDVLLENMLLNPFLNRIVPQSSQSESSRTSFLNLEKKHYLQLAQKLSEEQVQRLVEKTQSVQLFDLLLEAGRKVDLSTQNPETLLKIALHKSALFVLRELFTYPFSTEFLVELLLSLTKKQERQVLTGFLPQQGNYQTLLKSMFWEQLQFAHLPPSHFAEYLFLQSSAEEFARLLRTAPDTEALCSLQALRTENAPEERLMTLEKFWTEYC